MRPTSYGDQQTMLPDGVPMPIVKLNRWLLVVGIAVAITTQQPLITMVLFLLLLPAVLFGQRWSPVAIMGQWLLADRLTDVEREDRRLMRFNNTIAVLLLGAAQIAFAVGLPLVGWFLSAAVAVAAVIALAGFCVGCFLFYQFKLYRRRLFG